LGFVIDKKKKRKKRKRILHEVLRGWKDFCGKICELTFVGLSENEFEEGVNKGFSEL